MNEPNDPLKNLSEIRSMMERSSKILSLSGLAGVGVGIVALCGVMYAQYIHTRVAQEDVVKYLAVDAVVVL
ncbi:MAG: hypothetical protein AAB209_06375, partial [Bacteroidota bacterium]